jgi:hypothetical protein
VSKWRFSGYFFDKVGKYSLISYLFQIAFPKIILKDVISISRSWEVVLITIVVVLINIGFVNVVDILTSRYQLIHKYYKLIFA